MLELDLLLQPFARECYPGLDPELQAAYAELLELDDWLIYDWLQGRAPIAADFAEIIALVKEHNDAASRR